MDRQSSLGPVDPIVSGIQAYAAIEGIKTAYDEVIKDNGKVLVWNPILSRYTAAFVQSCQWAIQSSKDMVTTYLKDNMFSELPENERIDKASKIVEALTTLSSNEGHDKHIHYEECREMGLEVRLLEEYDGPLQDLVLTVHHCFMYTLSNTAAYKIIENHLGRRWIKLQQQIAFQLPIGIPQPQSLTPGSPAQ